MSKALISPLDKEVLVDVILSGVGAYPTFQWSLRRPLPLTDPTICETAIRTIFTALSDLSSAAKLQSTNGKPVEKPLLIPISTVGCGRRRGIPLSIYLPYHYLLGSPLADKLRMEEVVLKDKGAHVRDFVIMRPPFLTDGEARGDSVLRVGWEWGAERNDQAVKEPGPEIGYYVSRKDIGAWIFQKVVVQGGWEGKCVYLTFNTTGKFMGGLLDKENSEQHYKNNRKKCCVIDTTKSYTVPRNATMVGNYSGLGAAAP